MIDKTMPKKVPKLRFREFDEEWEKVCLDQLLSESKKRNIDLRFNKNDVFSVSGEYGIVNQIEHKGRSFAGASVHNYHVVKVGDVVYTKSPLKANPYGIIKTNKGKAGIVSTLYAVYSPSTNVSSMFLDYYFRLHDNVNKYLRPLVNKGAKNDMKINNVHVLSGKIYTPKKNEQEKIANFLSTIDDKVLMLRYKKELFAKYQRYITKAVFSQKIHMKDENGKSYSEWDEKSLGEIADRVTQRNAKNKNKVVLTNSAVQGIVSQGDFFNKDIANQNNLTNYFIVSTNNFVYNPRISKEAPVGPIKRNHLSEGVMSPLYSVFKFNSGNLDYFESYFETSYWHEYMKSIANFGARHDRMNITVSGLYDLPLPYPSREEQQKIADFLTALNDKINLVKKELEQTEAFKKALLQQMFM